MSPQPKAGRIPRSGTPLFPVVATPEPPKADLMSRKRPKAPQPTHQPESTPPEAPWAPIVAPRPEAVAGGWFPWWVPLALAAVAFLVRLPGLAWKDLWFDEVQTWTDFSYPPSRQQAHWLFFEFGALLATPFSDPTVAARFWPLLAGTLTVPVMWLAGRRFGGTFVGLLAAVLVALSPYHVEFSQEARFYAPMVLFAAISVWGGLFFLQESSSRRWAGPVASAVAGWAAIQHQPTAIPWVFGHLGCLGLAILFTRIGRDSIAQWIPALRGRWWYFAAGGALALAAPVVVWRVAPGLVRDSFRTIFLTPWGQSEHVDFTPGFFAEHAVSFGLDVFWLPPLLVGGVVALLVLAAMALRIRRDFIGTALVLLPMAAQLLAVFAVSRPGVAYLAKYSICMMPGMVLLTAAGVVWLGRSARVVAVSTAVLAILLVPGLIRYHATQKMPLRPLLSWVNENEPGSATVCLYGHMGYQGALYAGTLAPRHGIVYFPWYRKADAGLLEVETIRRMAERGPVYIARAWQADVPAPLDALMKSSELVLRVPSSAGDSQEGRLYRVAPGTDSSIESGMAALRVRDFDRLRRPAVVGSALEMNEAAAVVYTAPLRAGTSYSLDLSLSGSADRWRVLALHSPAFDRPVIHVVNPTDQPSTTSLGFRAERDADWLQIAHVSDYPERRNPAHSFRLHGLKLRAAEAPPGLRPSAGPVKWTPEVLARWMQPKPFLAPVAGGTADLQPFRMTAWEGNLIAPPQPVKPGDLVYTSVGLRTIDLYGVGGNAGMLFLDAGGNPILQGLSSYASHNSVIRWAPVEGPLHWSKHWFEFESVRQAPPGAAAVALYLPFWKTENRNYPNAANRLEVRAPVVTILAPNAESQ